MIQTIFPLFERGRILKKEMLSAIRDYAFDFGQLLTEGYSDGILTGCGLTVSSNTLIVGKGIIKYQGFLYLVSQPQAIPYYATDVFVACKVRFRKVQQQADFVCYDAELVLDEELSRRQNELELCRFKLKEGFTLRNDYTCFEDIQTEFDTVNLADATFSCLDGPGVSPLITRRFAREAMEHHLTNQWDILFCMQCLNSSCAVSPLLLKRYLMERLQLDEAGYDGRNWFDYLAMTLRNIQNGTENLPGQKKREKREIFLV